MKRAGIVIVGVLLAPMVAHGDSTVVSQGCKTFIKTKIEITNDAGASQCDAPKTRGGASKAVAKKIRRGIEGCSPSKVGGYSLGGCCKVIEQATVRVRKHGKKPRPGYNQIEITTDPDYVSCVSGKNAGTWSTAESGNTYAHETGHLLGLEDQYFERTDSDGNRVTPPYPGHEMDKMGAPGGKLGAGPAPRAMLDALLVQKGARCPQKCCGTTTTLPPGTFTWTGTLRWVYTDDDTYQYTDPIGGHTRSNHLHAESLWTITMSTPTAPPDTKTVLDTTWNGTFSFTKDEQDMRTDCVGGIESLMLTSSGQGAGPQQFRIDPFEDTTGVTLGIFGSATNQVQITGTVTTKGCNGPTPITQPADTSRDDGLGAMLSCMGLDSSGILTPDPGNPRHYAGRNTCDHHEIPQLGGARITDQYVEWDLLRSP